MWGFSEKAKLWENVVYPSQDVKMKDYMWCFTFISYGGWAFYYPCDPYFRPTL